MKKNSFYLLLIPLLLLAGCNGGNTTSNSSSSVDTSEVQPSVIEITSPSSQTSIKVGETLQLSAKVTPANASQAVTWSTSNQEVASVDANGLVTAKKVGNVIITATSKTNPSISGEYALIIEEAPVEEIAPTKITINGQTEVNVGDSVNLTIAVEPSDAIDTVTWSSSNEAVATISNRGALKALSEGEVTVTATSTIDTNVKGEITIKVNKADIPDPTVDWSTIEFTSHDDYMNAEDKTPIKVKGVVTVKSNVKSGTFNYYIQNGNDGFYVYGQDSTTFPIETGKTYEIGGFKKYYRGGAWQIVDVEHCVALDETISANINSLEGVNISSIDECKTLYGSLVSGKEFSITSVPDSVSSSFNFDVKLNDNAHTIRVDSTLMSEEEFKAIGDLASSFVVGQTFDLNRAIMAAYGYGNNPDPQILVLDADDIVLATLSAEEKVEVVKNNLTVKQSIENTIDKIDLPTVSDNFADVTISWASSNEQLIANDGSVNHPKRDTYVKLTATISCGSVSQTIEFDVNVLAKDESYLEVVHVLDLEDALDSSSSYGGTSDSKSGYGDGNITLGTPNATWLLRNSLIGQDKGDIRNGKWAIRIQSYPDSTLENTGRVELQEDLSFNTVELKIASYGSDPLGSYINIAYSTDSGVNYIDVASIKVIAKEFNIYRITLPETANRVSIYETGASARVRNNIDDIRLLNAK